MKVVEKTGEQRFQLIFCFRNRWGKGGGKRAIHECRKCDAGFFHMTKLIEHLKNVHGIERAFKCDQCGKSFRSPMNIKRHKLIHTGLKKFACDLCNYTCNQKTNLEHHRRRHAKDYAYKCELCDKGFLSRAEYVEHSNIHTGKKPYTCELCPKSYPYKNNLIVHKRIHHPGLTKKTDSHNCALCSSNFPYKRLLTRHMKSQHGIEQGLKIFLCDFCGKQVSSQSVLVTHRRMHTGEKPASCELCGKRFSTRENLKLHKRTHTGEKPHVCLQCGKGFTQRTSLVFHMRYHTGQRPYQCSICKKGFVSNTFLKKHEKSHVENPVSYQWSLDHEQFDETEFKVKIENDPIAMEAKSESNVKACEICNEKFHFVTRLVAHLRIAHGIQRPFKCTSCWRTYAQQFMLNAHVKKSHTPKNVSCEQCKFICVTNADLERHRKKQHETKAKFYCEICCETFADNESYATHTAMHNFIEYQQCNHCGITFNDLNSLKEHHRLYHFDTPATSEQAGEAVEDHKCDICGKSYRFKSVLKQHKVNAHGTPNYERPRRRYLCALCGKELKTAKGFEIHNRSHTGEKPYTCEVCGKCFACETLLRTHNVTHTGERKYTCEQCGKSFTQRSTLVVHKRYHTGERPYVCPKCSKGFVTRTVLNTHLKSCR